MGAVGNRAEDAEGKEQRQASRSSGECINKKCRCRQRTSRVPCLVDWQIAVTFYYYRLLR